MSGRVRILAVHNRYLQRGGEDVVLDREVGLLRAHGHEVELFVETNQGLEKPTFRDLAATALGSVWSADAYRKIRDRLSAGRFDLLHVHNTFPRLSPSVYWAASARGVPVVHTLHNYRLVCANGLLLRDGSACADCVGRLPVPALLHGCYRHSRSGTLPVVAMQQVHRALGTWRSRIRTYIALTGFARDLMVAGGLPESRVYVKPNSTPDPLAGQNVPALEKRERSLLFAGRITYEKGLDILLDAWARVDSRGWALNIAGDGPELRTLRQRFGTVNGVRWWGWLGPDEITDCLRKCRGLVLPSRWYEGFPMILVEALATGVPCIVPDHGGLPEIIGDGQAGHTFTAGSAASLAGALKSAMESGLAWEERSTLARRIYVEKYHPESNYQQLMQIYDDTLTGD